MQCVCPNCEKPFEVASGAFNRSAALGYVPRCSRKCAGAMRRKEPLPEAARKALKADYDRKYRERNREKRKAQKAEYHRRIYDPVAAAEHRKARMPKHVEYCRRPEYRQYKRQYDRKYRAKKDFGAFADAALVLRDLEAEILTHATRYEIGLQNGTICKAQIRKRRYASAQRAKPEISPMGNAPNGPLGSYGGRTGGQRGRTGA